ncbi:MAG: ATP-binding protein [Chlorobi bacterium]|nr:ATP-binding protein [Chlorobiota bacterium]
MQYIERKATASLLQGIRTMPVVFINGPRQCGKSTLVNKISEQLNDAQYVSFDDPSVYSFASSDTEGFLNSFGKTAIIDEVQLVPDVFRQIKSVVDKGRLAGKNMNGRFVLTGSANILAIPNLAKALVGRVQLMPLFPFSTSEIICDEDNFIDEIFNSDSFKTIKEIDTIELIDAIGSSTYPQLSLDEQLDKPKWLNDYINTLLFRDVRNISQIVKLQELPKLLQIIASRAGGLLNEASLSRASGLNQMTLRRYRALLHGIFLVFSVPAWHANIGKRMVKAPKDYIIDTMMLLNLLGLDTNTIGKSLTINRAILENFIAVELTKRLSLFTDINLYHFRTTDNKEIDFVLERNNGDIVAIEVKNTMTVKPDDFRQLKLLSAKLPDKFLRGIVLYRGNKILPFSKNMLALPIDVLWAKTKNN